MPSFGRRSLRERGTLHPKLQRVFDLAITRYDFSIICGHRGEEAQTLAFKSGHSTVEWPGSKHNKRPSRAGDCIPYLPTSQERAGVWENIEAFREMAVVILYSARELGIKLEWGGYWTRIKDYPHFQLAEEEE